MEEVLNKANVLIENANNIPNDIKPIVKIICRGYIRESNGKIPIEGIINVCNTTFEKIDENNKSFSGNENIMGNTNTDYDDDCNVIHKMCYMNSSNYIKLITILTHELGHVITESKPCVIFDNGIYPFAKRTVTIYQNCLYKENQLQAQDCFGYRLSDGFLESICTKIFDSSEFRQEMYAAGYDLQDYIYKDERIFPSRVYDEFKACFELFDYIMDGALFDFACMSFKSNEEMIEYIKKHKLNIIFEYLDNCNDALWAMKSYEGKESDDKFINLLQVYLNHKDIALNVANVVLDLYGKNEKDIIYEKLYEIYSSTLNKQKQLPIPEEYIINRNQQKL